MHGTNLILISSLLAVVSRVTDGQSGETVRQKADHSPCSNIVAKGNVTNNCPKIVLNTKTTIERKAEFAVQLPFIYRQWSSGVPMDENWKDPLALTYAELSELGTPPATMSTVNGLHTEIVPGIEPRTFLENAIGFEVLKLVFALEDPKPTYSYSPQDGQRVHSVSPVNVPDESELAKERWKALIEQIALLDPAVPESAHHLVMSHKLLVPRGTNIVFTAPANLDGSCTVLFERKPAYKLQISVSWLTESKGVLPNNYVIDPNQRDVREVHTFVYQVRMHFQWNGPIGKGQDYKEWSEAVFAGLRKHLTVTEN